MAPGLGPGIRSEPEEASSEWGRGYECAAEITWRGPVSEKPEGRGEG